MSAVLLLSIILGILWIAGWVGSYFATSACQEPSLCWRAFLIAVLFFIWPYLAYLKARSRR